MSVAYATATHVVPQVLGANQGAPHGGADAPGEAPDAPERSKRRGGQGESGSAFEKVSCLSILHLQVSNFLSHTKMVMDDSTNSERIQPNPKEEV